MNAISSIRRPADAMTHHAAASPWLANGWCTCMRRTARLAALLLCGFPALLSAAASSTPTDIRELAECRLAVERVLWEHRLWPETNPGPKPDLDAVLDIDDVARRMHDILLRADALDKRWGQLVDALALQQELEPVRRTSQDPDVLRALIVAAGSDERAAPCVALPDLVLREFDGAYAADRQIQAARCKAVEMHLDKAAALPGVLAGPPSPPRNERRKA
jgi:hypothetical protein